MSKEPGLIRSEFECFVRIGQDSRLRNTVLELIDKCARQPASEFPSVYLETRDAHGSIREMWYLEFDSGQVHRLQEFLQRFTPEEVQMMESLVQKDGFNQ